MFFHYIYFFVAFYKHVYFYYHNIGKNLRLEKTRPVSRDDNTAPLFKMAGKLGIGLGRLVAGYQLFVATQSRQTI